MSPRMAAPHASAVDSGRSRRRPRPDDSQNLAAALAVLDAHRRDTLLEAVAIAAKELLRSSDLAVSLPKVIEQIGLATGVDRAHIFLIDAAAGVGHILQHYAWTVPGIATPPEFRNAKDPMAAVGLESWIPRLERGEVITGHVCDFDPDTRAFFDLGGVKSTLCVPAFADGQWLGMIGFDDCRNERDWSAAEIDTIKTVAELVGASMARTARLKTLADANRIIESSPTILYRLSPQKPFPLIYLSKNVRRYGYEADELLASPGSWFQLFESEYHPEIAADIKSIIEGKAEHTLIEFRLKKPDGSHAWLEGRGYPVRDEGRRLVAIEGILTDITERKSVEDKIAALARNDFLTGLANRAAFIERLQLALARARRGASLFAVHYLDLDHFKDVKDTLGHPVGDALLQEVADRLRSCVRETDLVARFGGDEFAVLQDDITDVGNIEVLAT
jgi:PAS domain S-box-containing protein